MVEDGDAAIVRRRIGQAYGHGNLAVVDELFAPDDAVDGRHLGRDGVKDAVGRIKGAFPDLAVDLEELVANRDRVVVRVLTRGTHAGPFMGIEVVDELGLPRQPGALG